MRARRVGGITSGTSSTGSAATLRLRAIRGLDG